MASFSQLAMELCVKVNSLKFDKIDCDNTCKTCEITATKCLSCSNKYQGVDNDLCVLCSDLYLQIFA